MDLDKEENIQFVKQHSEKWFSLHKQARITGSTFNSAICLDTLSKQKEHHYINVRGRKPPPIPPALQKKFDHGTKNEINATSTLITTIVPAYLPACYCFYEVGPAFVDSANRKRLLEVSVDSILRCAHGGKDCPNYHIHGDRVILVEMKSPVPQENIAETIFYEVPSRYMPQTQSQLKAYNCSELWLVCSTAVSVSLIVIYFDPELWSKLWQTAVDLYEAEKPNIPTKLHKSIPAIRQLISKSKNTHTKFLCEVPTITGEYGNLTITRNCQSPYATIPCCLEMPVMVEEINKKNRKLYIEAKCAFKECHQVLREPAKELLVFMLTDKDRKQQKNVPYSYLVAYAMKGNSMSNRILKDLVNEVRSQLAQRNIPILCEVYDGQWHKYVTESSEGCRLTKLYGRDNWNKYSLYSKDKCIEELARTSVVKNLMHKQISEMTGDQLSMPEIEITKGLRGEIYTGTKFRVMQNIHSIHPTSRPDLFEKN